MITLTIDTCDQNGSVGVRVNGHLIGLRRHANQDYSSWLLPAVESSLAEAGKKFSELDLLAVATGPGSFTGVRVGLCAVKAWAEVYQLPVVGVSRLSAMARQGTADGWVATTYDAHRGQLFGGLYLRGQRTWSLVEQEMVISPQEFLTFVAGHSQGEPVRWVCMQPELIRDLPEWKALEVNGSSILASELALAGLIGELAEEKAAQGEFCDVLQLDANYVRRCDAEIYWKGPAHRAG